MARKVQIPLGRGGWEAAAEYRDIIRLMGEAETRVWKRFSEYCGRLNTDTLAVRSQIVKAQVDARNFQVTAAKGLEATAAIAKHDELIRHLGERVARLEEF